MSQDFWNSCLDALKKDIPEHNFTMWIYPLQVILNQDSLVILAPNEFILNGLRSQFFNEIQNVVSKVNGAPMDIKFGVGNKKDYKEAHENRTKKSSTKKSTSGKSKKSLLNSIVKEHPIETSNLNPEFNFESYVEGRSNTFAFAACSGVAKKPGTNHNPLFIHGNTGLGKTHLMHAVGNAILVTYPDARIMYQHCDSFVDDIVRTIRNGKINELRHFYKSLDVLLIDDIQLLSGKETSQEIFFHTFNALLDGGQQVILTCDRYPKELNAIEDRLKSRFASGLIVHVEPPELEHRISILEKKAIKWGIELDRHCAFFIAQTVKSNVRELEGALKQVSALAKFRGSMLTLAIAQEALGDLVNLHSKIITLPNIQKIVCDFYKIKVTDLQSKSRLAKIAKPRQIAMYIARCYTDTSLPEIGKFFDRDHSTVMHACKKIVKELELNLEMKREFEILLSTLKV